MGHMPCNCDGYEPVPDYRKKADDIANMLCQVLGSLGDTKWLPPDIQAWWKEHQAMDRKRTEVELLQQKRELEQAEKAVTAAQERLKALKRKKK